MAHNFSCLSHYEDDKYYWFSEMQYNGFYRVEKETGERELLCRFPEEDMEEEYIHSDIQKVGDWFVLSPRRGQDIVLYHTLTKEVKTIPLLPVSEERKLKNRQAGKFSSMAVFQGKVFFFPLVYPAVVMLDLSTMKLRNLTTGIDILEKDRMDSSGKKMIGYFKSSVQVEDKVYLPSAYSNHLLIIDLKKYGVKSFSIPTSGEGFQDIAFDGTFFWLTPIVGKELVKWSPQGSEIVYLGEASWYWMYGCHEPMVYKNRLLILARRENIIYDVNMETHQVSHCVPLMESIEKIQGLNKRNNPLMFCSWLEGDTLHFICGKDHRWYAYDLEQEVLTSEAFPVDEVGEEILSRRPMVLEATTHCTLMDFCDYIIGTEEEIEDETPKISVGELILKATT